MDIEFDRLDPPTISEEVRAGVERTMEAARQALRQAQPEQIMQAFAELEITHPRRRMSKPEHTVFSSKLKEDTDGLSAWALNLACTRWRQNPQNRFFPSGAELRALVADDVENAREVLENCQKILSYKPPEIDPKDRPMTKERLEEIRKEMGDATE